MNSVASADGVYVLDTGSTDDSVAVLRSLGATVETMQFSPFRFDVARNASLELAPHDGDIYVCLDLDEVMSEGWRDFIEKAAEVAPNANQFSYRYVWSHNPDGSDGVVFWSEKIHRRGFRWKGAVHEVLAPIEGNTRKSAYIYGLTVEHFPDSKKSRSSYLPLLEIAAKEEPENDRTAHYLGREYLFKGKYDLAIRELMRHLSLPSATWADERAASMRYISECYSRTGRTRDAVAWALRAVAESPDTREPYLRLARAFYALGDYEGVLYAASAGLRITERKLTYITEPDAWGAPLHDLLSLAYYKLGLIEKAKAEAEIALSFGPDPRIKANLDFYINELNKDK